MSKHLTRLAVAAALAIVATAARAGTANANMTVTANVISNCTIAVTDLSFGNYDPINVNATADAVTTAGVTLACTKNKKVDVTLTKGSLANGASTLNYGLYSDSNHLVVWDDSVAGTVSPIAVGKAGQTLTVYGVIPAGQDPDVGGYTGTVVATVTF